MHQALIFLIALIAPFILIRTLLFLISKPISRIRFHTRKGLKFHHFHYGLIVIFIGDLALLFTGHHLYAIALLGFGLGMVLDEFIATLELPETEPADTKIYVKSFLPTLLLMIGLAVLLIIFFFLK